MAFGQFPGMSQFSGFMRGPQQIPSLPPPQIRPGFRRLNPGVTVPEIEDPNGGEQFGVPDFGIGLIQFGSQLMGRGPSRRPQSFGQSLLDAAPQAMSLIDMFRNR